MKAADRLIAAMDGDWNLLQLLEMGERLSGEVGMVKLGKRLFTRLGPDAVRGLVKLKLDLFLDLKYHDIPNTVADACSEAVSLGVSMLNVHASGGLEMMSRARAGVDSAAKSMGVKAPRLIAVTVLTSMDKSQLSGVGILDDVKDQVVRLALLAKEAGIDGVVASPLEVKLIREALGPDFLVVTPGIRLADKKIAGDDQKRVMTPYDAVNSGVDYIVMGRPIYGADDPAKAARAIVAQMDV